MSKVQPHRVAGGNEARMRAMESGVGSEKGGTGKVSKELSPRRSAIKAALLAVLGRRNTLQLEGRAPVDGMMKPSRASAVSMRQDRGSGGRIGGDKGAL